MREIRKNFQGAQIWPPETNRNTCFWVFLLMREFFAWGTHKDQSNIYSETKNGQIAKSPKISNVFKLHKSFPGRQLNAASRKTLEIQASCIAKRRTLLNRKFCWIKVLRCCNTTWKSKLRTSYYYFLVWILVASYENQDIFHATLPQSLCPPKI